MTTVQPFLMFSGQAEDAMRFYVSLFNQAEINELHRYGASEEGQEGTVRQGIFTIHGQTLMCTDSHIDLPAFNPSISIFVTFDREDELQHVYTNLSQGGEVLLPLDLYTYKNKFGWVTDQFGVSWQLSLYDSN